MTASEGVGRLCIAVVQQGLSFERRQVHIAPLSPDERRSQQTQGECGHDIPLSLPLHYITRSSVSILYKLPDVSCTPNVGFDNLTRAKPSFTCGPT